MRNKISYVALVGLALLIFSNCKQQVTSDLVITNAHIIDVETGTIAYGMDVIIIENEIRKMVPHKNGLAYKANSIVDATGKYIIPGLWDMHVHLSMIGEQSIPLFVLNGIIGVRDMGGDWSELEQWRTKGESSNQTLYPKIKTAGPILESPQFYNVLHQILGGNYIKDRIAIDTEEQAQKVVDSLVGLGVDLIKVRTVKSPEIFKAISTACEKNAIPFSGHIDNNIGIAFAIENGIASIEHDAFLQSLHMDKEELNKTLATIGDSKVYLTPTLLATNNNRLKGKEELVQFINDTLHQNSKFREYLSPKLIENWRVQLSIQALEKPMKWDSLIVPLRSFTKSITTNSTVLAGTDSGVMGVVPGKGLHEELKLLVSELGLSNLEALQAATINATSSLGLQNQYGLVSPNHNADLLILNENPLDDISNTSNIFSVVRNGRIIDQNKIEKGFEDIASEVRQLKGVYQTETLNHLNAVLNQMRARASIK